MERYPLVKWAKEVITKQGNLGAILNASNEEAVYAFLDDKIAFLDIDKLIEKAMINIAYIPNPTLDQIVDTDKKTRVYIKNIISKGVND